MHVRTEDIIPQRNSEIGSFKSTQPASLNYTWLLFRVLTWFFSWQTFCNHQAEVVGGVKVAAVTRRSARDLFFFDSDWNQSRATIALDPFSAPSFFCICKLNVFQCYKDENEKANDVKAVQFLPVKAKKISGAFWLQRHKHAITFTSRDGDSRPQQQAGKLISTKKSSRAIQDDVLQEGKPRRPEDNSVRKSQSKDLNPGAEHEMGC